MISPKKIQFNNKTNYSFPTFNLLCDVAFDSDSGETSTGLNRDIIATENYNGKIKYATSSKYNEVLAPRITLIKEDYSDLTPSEQRQILSWLTSKNTPSYMDLYDDPYSNAIIYSLLGLPTSIEAYKLTNNRTVGIVFTFECITPFAFSPLRTTAHTVTTPTSVTINCESDDYESLVYPKITIQENGKIIDVESDSFFANNYINDTVYRYDGKFYWKKDDITYTAQESDTSEITTTGVYIENTTTNINATTVGGNGINEKIVIDGANRIISSDNELRIFGDSFSWNWLGLKSGANNIKIMGDCTITFEWRDPIKIGESI